MLSLKRIDGVITNKDTAAHELKRLGFSTTISPSQFIVFNEASYFTFSKKKSIGHLLQNLMMP
ncbi:MAG: hypothetical protein ACJASG_002330 [Oleiphilaceae bacterium]|jgi:hypothetical protein